ncbi:MAG: PEP-CTERM system histidine kinase PrsK [Gammaproteobacteria bacterium]|nr:PEP-CTERM system histidine kinase PrsK [Gammaproteobacteria bacterium]
MTIINIAATGYGICAVTFLFLTIILAVNWRGHSQSALLISACIATIVWSLLCAYQVYYPDVLHPYLRITELFRNLLWISFLFYLLDLRAQESSKNKTLLMLKIFATLLVLSGVLVELGGLFVPYIFNAKLVFIILIVITLLGLILVEQLFRNTPMDQRWSIKFFCVGVGGVFAYDFYMYADSLLMVETDQGLMSARGYVNAMVSPLIAISASRNPQWALRVHVSKRFVFHSAAILGSGFYLLAMGAGGYYVKQFGGTWGGIAQVILLTGALILLLLLLFSGYIRARIRVFLSKNFFHYKYDYRDEWLKLINAMAMEQNDYQIRSKAIMVVADIVESPAGILCLKEDDGVYRTSVNWNMRQDGICETEASSLVEFLSRKQWVINIDEVHEVTELYDGLELPRWVGLLPQAWLILPFLHRKELIGFAVLARSRIETKINWEDRDLLLTAARQISSYLVLLRANEELMNAKQFDAFNRLSAYVVHDLKNLVAQLSLVVSNAARFKNNPEFMQDAIETVQNATEKMQKLLDGLRQNRPVGTVATENILLLIKDVIRKRGGTLPIPEYIGTNQDIFLPCERDRFQSVLEHLVENAQQATDASGWVRVSLSRQGNGHIELNVADSGCGMDDQFIKERLFKPFQTTKGNAGMGIGVYEAREYFRSLGGTMSVISEIDKGSSFTVVFPNNMK